VEGSKEERRKNGLRKKKEKIESFDLEGCLYLKGYLSLGACKIAAFFSRITWDKILHSYVVNTTLQKLRGYESIVKT